MVQITYIYIEQWNIEIFKAYSVVSTTQTQTSQNIMPSGSRPTCSDTSSLFRLCHDTHEIFLPYNSDSNNNKFYWQYWWLFLHIIHIICTFLHGYNISLGPYFDHANIQNCAITKSVIKTPHVYSVWKSNTSRQHGPKGTLRILGPKNTGLHICVNIDHSFMTRQ